MLCGNDYYTRQEARTNDNLDNECTWSPGVSGLIWGVTVFRRQGITAFAESGVFSPPLISRSRKGTIDGLWSNLARHFSSGEHPIPPPPRLTGNVKYYISLLTL